MSFSFPVIHNAVDIMAPYLLAGLGGLFTELSGMLNIALEGLILIGAFFSVIFASLSGNLMTGILLGASATLSLALIFGLITIYLKANEFITGLAVNLMAGGIIALVSFHFYGTRGNIVFSNIGNLPVLSIPRLNSIPVVGDILLGHDVLVYFSLFMVLAAWYVIYKTPFGFRLRGAGRNPKALVAIGLEPKLFKLTAILISGLTCSLAGAGLTLNLGAWVPNISSGRGWIALVVIYLGGRNPVGILAASFVFGLAESLSNWAQGFINIPPDFILAFPYLLTVTAMVIASAVKQRRSQKTTTY